MICAVFDILLYSLKLKYIGESMKRLIGELAFVIEGSSVVAHARDMVKDGEWEKASAFLKESVIEFPLEYVFGVLKGEMTLTGNSKDKNIMLEEDNNSEQYKKKLKEMYMDKYFYNDSVLFKFSHILKGEEVKEYAAYLKSDTRKHIFIVEDEIAIIAFKENENVIPEWYNKNSYPQSANDFYENMSIELKEHIKFLSREDEQKYKFKKLQDVLRKDILEACNERKVTWKKISVRSLSGETVERNVPMELAFAYISRDSNIWKPVSKSGLKMYNDSAFHSDLWLAMGYDIDGQEYNTDNPETFIFYSLMNNIRSTYNKAGEFDVLNDTKLESFKGRVVFESTKDITDKDVLVLPNANLKYDSIAKKAGMVITESGGPVSHLVIAGREEMFPVIIMKDAIKKLYNYSHVEVDFKEKTIKGIFR